MIAETGTVRPLVGVEEICIVVRNTDGLYLDGKDRWNLDSGQAWEYGSAIAFEHAERFGGLAFLRLPSGREWPISEDDFRGGA